MQIFVSIKTINNAFVLFTKFDQIAISHCDSKIYKF